MPTDERAYHHGNLRTALLAAAERRLRQDGVDGLSLRELARDVGVSHAAPRRHFADRQALLDALALDGFARLHDAVRAAPDTAGDAYEVRLTATMRAYVEFATQNAALLELMFTRKHRDGADDLVAAAAPAFALMHDLVVEGQAAGHLGPGDPHQVGAVLFAQMQGIAALVNGALVSQALRDGLVEASVRQMVRGSQ